MKPKFLADTNKKETTLRESRQVMIMYNQLFNEEEDEGAQACEENKKNGGQQSLTSANKDNI